MAITGAEMESIVASYAFSFLPGSLSSASLSVYMYVYVCDFIIVPRSLSYIHQTYTLFPGLEIEDERYDRQREGEGDLTTKQTSVSLSQEP
jgi:hypothetical protein